MDMWVRMAIVNAQGMLLLLKQQKKIKLSKEDINILRGIRDLITSLIGE